MTEGCIKRVFDVLLTSFGLVVLSPVIILLVFLVQITLGSPVLFIQNRPGLNGKPFRIYKFRTMTDERGIDGSPLPDVERLGGFGRFLRSTSLDELPELLNVLKGDMSLVGPRPLLMEYLGRYSTEQARRHVIKPGITGWAQVNGRNALSWEDKFRLDVWYVDNQSLSLDVKILALTVWKTIKRENISGEGHATMSKFMGSGKNV